MADNRERNTERNTEQSAAWDSEKKLDTEEKSLIGDEAEDRNLTGSTTYVTLPDQGEENPREAASNNSSNRNNRTDDNSGDNNRGNKRS